MYNLSEYTILEKALFCFLGRCGNGSERKAFFGDEYEEIQDLVNRLAGGEKVHGSIYKLAQECMEGLKV